MIFVLSRPNPAFRLRRIGIVLCWNSPLVALRSTLLPSRNTSRMATSTSIQQPAWSPPRASADEPTLKVYNSLTRTKVSPTSLLGERELVFVAWTDDDVSLSADGVRPSQRAACQVVQLWAYCIRCVAHGTRQVTKLTPPPSLTFHAPQKI